ncbi:hypothetical protein [Phycicoccus jejuensis]|uniref:hypothetical protein n=1 Tax=Phycicoccus jejuensis TaxID=367299 RepID=UPI0004C418AC|nr:hypothetical protein [Phycicoccus jejuensis]
MQARRSVRASFERQVASAMKLSPADKQGCLRFALKVVGTFLSAARLRCVRVYRQLFHPLMGRRGFA